MTGLMTREKKTAGEEIRIDHVVAHFARVPTGRIWLKRVLPFRVLMMSWMLSGIDVSLSVASLRLMTTPLTPE